MFNSAQLSDFFNSDIGYFGGDWGIDGSDPKVEASLMEFLSIIKEEDPDFVIVTGWCGLLYILCLLLVI